MHEMQCIENIMSHEPKDPHTKSDDKEMTHQISKNKVWMLNPSQTSSMMKKIKKSDEVE